MDEELNLLRLLKQPGVTPEKVFSYKDSFAEIKLHLKEFVNFCLANKEFTQRLMDFVFLCPEFVSSQQQRSKVYAAGQFLSYSEDEMGKFYLGIETEKENTNSKPQAQILRDAQQLFSSGPKQTWDYLPQVFEKNEILHLVMKYVQNKQVIESALAYINKIVAFCIQKDSDKLHEFLGANSRYMDCMVDKIESVSLACALGQILTCKDFQNPKFSQFQFCWFQKIQQKLPEIIASETKMNGYLSFIEETFNHSRYHRVQSSKLQSNVIFAEKANRFFFSKLFEDDQDQIIRASDYLIDLLEKYKNLKSSHQIEMSGTESPLKIQIEFMGEQFNKLVGLLDKDIIKNKINVLRLIKGIISINASKLTFFQSYFKQLLNIIQKSTKKGMYLNGIWLIIQQIINETDEQHIQKYVQENLHKQDFTKYFDFQKNSILQENNSCFIRSIYLELITKCPKLLEGDFGNFQKSKLIFQQYDKKKFKDIKNTVYSGNQTNQNTLKQTPKDNKQEKNQYQYAEKIQSEDMSMNIMISSGGDQTWRSKMLEIKQKYSQEEQEQQKQNQTIQVQQCVKICQPMQIQAPNQTKKEQQ